MILSLVNPARAGMILSRAAACTSRRRKPRASGDDPRVIRQRQPGDGKPRASGDDPVARDLSLSRLR